jgi:putative redox protein
METTVRWTGNGGMSFLQKLAQAMQFYGWRTGRWRSKSGPRPMEMVLLGTGGCTAYDVVLILQRGKQDIRGCDVKLSAERAETEPKVLPNSTFTSRFVDVVKRKVERAIKLSHEKYCSASIMLAKTAQMTHSYEIIEDLTPPSVHEQQA